MIIKKIHNKVNKRMNNKFKINLKKEEEEVVLVVPVEEVKAVVEVEEVEKIQYYH